MKCNLIELAQQSDQHCTIEGRLNYKKITLPSYRSQPVYKERWFRLVKNHLFYFKISETGKFDAKNPTGVFIMENSSVQIDHRENFSFTICFKDEVDKCHSFAARSEDNVVQWVTKLQQCSYEFLRSQLHRLQSKIFSITGKDPLLLVPRNDGACLWAPSIPFSTVPACSINTASFSCHLHTNSAFTIERSKSDIQARRVLYEDFKNKSTFYTDFDIGDERNIEANFSLEKSKTSCCSDIGSSVFNNRPKYSRAAPSPPVRVKQIKNKPLDDKLVPQLSSSQDNLKRPIPPKRRASPVTTRVNQNTITQTERIPQDDDLITL